MKKISVSVSNNPTGFIVGAILGVVVAQKMKNPTDVKRIFGALAGALIGATIQVALEKEKITNK